jgi:rhamnosyl/mannosyltransferase
MYGKPLISSEIGTGTSFINNHNETGFVIPPDDAISLHSALQALWSDDKLCEQFGQAARTRFDKYFTADQMAKSYFALYQSLKIQKGT